MKCFFACLLLLPALLRAQDEPIYDPTEQVDKHLSVALHVKSGMFGLLYDNDVMLPFEYTAIDVYPDYLLLHKENGFGATDRKGKLIVPAIYDKLAGVEDSIGYGNANAFLASKNGKWGCIDLTGKVVVPMEFDAIEYWAESAILTKGNLVGAMDYAGNTVVPFRYSEIQACDDLGEYFYVRSPGDSLVALIDPKQDKLGNGYLPTTATLFAHQTEVTIREWFAYMAHVKSSYFTGGDTGWQVLIPDTNAVEPKLRPAYRWFISEMLHDYGTGEHLGEMVPKQKYTMKFGKKPFVMEFPYSKDKQLLAMLDFPATGISEKQVAGYAEWLTGLYSERYAGTYYSRPFFRLPTEAEWTEMAELGLHDTMKVNHVLDSVNAKGCMLYIYDNLPHCSNYEAYVKASLGGGTVPVMRMNADYNGIYQLFGNVAEMVAEKGIAKGGSYAHPASAAETTERQGYAKLQPWLGFRLVAELRVE